MAARLTARDTAILQPIADSFIAILRSWLTPAEWRQMNARNQSGEYEHCCASHDFCDANEALLQAMAQHGYDALEEDPGVWDAIWKLADPQLRHGKRVKKGAK